MSVKPIIYMLQEEVGSAGLTNLEEAQNWVDNPKNRFSGLKFNAILQTADELNQNKRIYAKRAIIEAVARQERLMRQGHWWVEQSHPLTTDPRRFSTILMENSVAKIDNCYWKGNILEAELTTLQNRVGVDMKNILLQGINMGFSMRGMGTVSKKNGNSIVENNLRIVTYDAVLNPSHATALSSEIITESQISDMIKNQSENFKILQETLFEEAGGDVEIIGKNDISYNLAENTAIVCADGSCMKIFLEDHIKELCKNSFSDLVFG